MLCLANSDGRENTAPHSPHRKDPVSSGALGISEPAGRSAPWTLWVCATSSAGEANSAWHRAHNSAIFPSSKERFVFIVHNPRVEGVTRRLLDPTAAYGRPQPSGQTDARFGPRTRPQADRSVSPRRPRDAAAHRRPSTDRGAIAKQDPVPLPPPFGMDDDPHVARWVRCERDPAGRKVVVVDAEPEQGGWNPPRPDPAKDGRQHAVARERGLGHRRPELLGVEGVPGVPAALACGVLELLARTAHLVRNPAGRGLHELP
jgi:hypothetical protein